MNKQAPLLAQPVRFVSRLSSSPGTLEAQLCVSIEVGQPLLELMFDLWNAVSVVPQADEITAWSAASTYQLFDAAEGADDGDAQVLELAGPRHEVILGIPVTDARERGIDTFGCGVTVYADGDAVFYVNLNGVANALWTESVFVLRNLDGSASCMRHGADEKSLPLWPAEHS